MAEYREFQDGELISGTRYRVVRLIGAGGMGTVYEVEHTELGKRFVLKALLRELSRREDLVLRLRNEWRALGRLEHPNIVTVTDAGTSSTGVPFYVMERLEGETLAQRMSRARRFSVRDSLEIASGVLEGLAAAHEIGVVHRDVKPPNIFLLSGGRAKVLDFGVAKIVDDPGVVTARGIAVGTPRYMAPEQARGEGVDGRADVYAVGLILFETITGVSPFDDARDANELILAHLAKAPPRLSTLAMGVPRALDAMVTSMLAKSRDDRPETAREAARRLRELVRFLEQPSPARVSPALSGGGERAQGASGSEGCPDTTRPDGIAIRATRPDGIAIRARRPARIAARSGTSAARSAPQGGSGTERRAPVLPLNSRQPAPPADPWPRTSAVTLIGLQPPISPLDSSAPAEARVRAEGVSDERLSITAVTRSFHLAGSLTPPPPVKDLEALVAPNQGRRWIGWASAMVCLVAALGLWRGGSRPVPASNPTIAGARPTLGVGALPQRVTRPPQPHSAVRAADGSPIGFGVSQAGGSASEVSSGFSDNGSIKRVPGGHPLTEPAVLAGSVPSKGSAAPKARRVRLNSSVREAGREPGASKVPNHNRDGMRGSAARGSSGGAPASRTAVPRPALLPGSGL